ncbi:MAG: hypothetical protein NC213_03600 [Acetobacter sp.]|nr:hypothetical protein [Bacteroides sp.]MCM1340808.1 hypothetical protein [Acetobacter sp.]MCM1432635.1 hypothetical protein [Clostridiales bacterium]
MANEKVMLIELSAENTDDSTKEYVADIRLPASVHEIDDAIERCRGYLVKTNIMPFGISECERVPLLSELRFDSPNLYELNFLAKQISEFDTAQLAAYNALLPLVVGDNYENDLISIKDVINLTYSVDDYSVASNIFNDTELGEMIVDNNMVEGIENLSDEIIELLDYEKVGEAHRMAENGVYVNGCYVSREGFKLKEVFNGETIPVHEFDKYMFRFRLSRYDGIPMWINAPLDENSEQILKNANADEFNLIDFVSAIPQIEKYSDEMHPKITMAEINRIDKLCQNFMSLDEIQSIKFKAALCFEDVQTLDDVNRINLIMKNADSYNLKYFNVYSSDFAKDYLEQHLDESFPKEYLELINTQALGDRLLSEYCGKYTPYGILLKSSNEQILSNERKHEFMLTDFLSKHVLFTEDRLTPEEIPEGLHKYEFRAGAEYTYATLEEKVGVDFSGTILSKVPFDLGEDEYIDLEKEIDGIPDFLDVEMSIDEFINSDFDPEENEDFEEDEYQIGGMGLCQ